MTPDLQLDLLRPHGVAHLNEYFGVWAIEERAFRAGCEHVGKLDLRTHVAQQQAAGVIAPIGQAQSGYQILKGGVAVITLAGTLMKQASSFSGGTSTVAARRQLRAAAQDETVSSIVLHIDSPGGTVAGTKDLADDVRQAGQSKPVIAYIEDLGASAAYWIAAQASKIHANETGLVGSIGTFMVVEDQSGFAEQLGVKVHVIRAGDFKGSGVPGTEVTDAQLAEWQRLVNGLNAHFLQAVADGRRLELAQVRDLADGRVHVGADAKKLRLVDAVQSFDETVAQLQAKAAGKGRMKAMSEPNAPQAATIAELKAACPGADSGFLVAQMEAGATVAVAAAAWLAEQQKQLAALKAENEELKTKTAPPAGAQPPAKRAGVQPVVDSGKPAGSGSSGAESGDAVADFNAAVLAQMNLNGGDRRAAVLSVARTRPDLHQAYLMATQTSDKARQLLASS
jgi:signal peptide peptidase SppA